MRFREIIAEEVFGGVAAVYHRTKTVDNIFNIENHGYVPGAGATYGLGIYATYDFASQQRGEMLKYGDYIVKNKLHLQGFVIFDMDIARAVYGDKHTMADQCRMFGMERGERWDWMLGKNNERKPTPFDSRKPGFTSNVAYEFYDDASFWQHKSKIKGLVFTGERDGRVVVAYDPKAVVPYAYTTSTKDDLDKQSPNEFQWTPLDVRKNAARRFARPTLIDRAKQMFSKTENREDIALYKWFLRHWQQLPKEDADEIFGNLVENAYRWVLNMNVRMLLTDEDCALLEKMLEQPDYRWGMDKLAQATVPQDREEFRREREYAAGLPDWDWDDRD